MSLNSKKHKANKEFKNNDFLLPIDNLDYINTKRIKLLTFTDEENRSYLKLCRIKLNSVLPKEIVKTYDVGIILKNPNFTSFTPNDCYISSFLKPTVLLIDQQNMFKNGFHSIQNRNIAEIISRKKKIFSMKKLELYKSNELNGIEQNGNHARNFSSITSKTKKNKKSEMKLEDKYNIILCEEEKVAKRIQESFDKLQNLAFTLKKITPNQELYSFSPINNEKEENPKFKISRCYSEKKSELIKRKDYDGELFNILEFKGVKFDKKKFEKSKNSCDPQIDKKIRSSKELISANKNLNKNNIKNNGGDTKNVKSDKKKVINKIPINKFKSNSNKLQHVEANQKEAFEKKQIDKKIKSQLSIDKVQKEIKRTSDCNFGRDSKFSNENKEKKNTVTFTKTSNLDVFQNINKSNKTISSVKTQIMILNSSRSNNSGINNLEGSVNTSKQFDSIKDNNVEKLDPFTFNSNSSLIELNKTDSYQCSKKNSAYDFTQEDFLVNRASNNMSSYLELKESQDNDIICKLIKNNSMLSKVTENTNSHILEEESNLSKNNYSMLSKISMSNDSISIDYYSDKKK
jgi:hypothetical protein